MRTHTFFLKKSSESVWVPIRKKRTGRPFQKTTERAVGSDSLEFASLRTHSVSYDLPQNRDHSCPWVHITTFNSKSPCYQTVGFLLCVILLVVILTSFHNLMSSIYLFQQNQKSQWMGHYKIRYFHGSMRNLCK